ncbi:hypothetical protein BW716_32460 [[Flexibacter] sp. ATCC 35208]|nr:hypothetical protein BW716_32460 [[Flexibacter] sp. ATCC 35208]
MITTQDKLYQALSTDASMIDPATKEVLRYREAVLYGFNFYQAKRLLKYQISPELQRTSFIANTMNSINEMF